MIILPRTYATVPFFAHYFLSRAEVLVVSQSAYMADIQRRLIIRRQSFNIGLLYHKRFTISKVNGYITITRMPCKV